MNKLKLIYSLLLPEELKKGLWVGGATFIIAILDFIGLAALLPILYYLLEEDKSKAALWFCLLAIGVISLKNIAITLLSRYQHRYLLSLYKRISLSLYTAYYRNGLLFIREQGVNRLGYEINFTCYAFCMNMLASLLRITGDGLLIGLVLGTLLIYDWSTALILIVSFVPFMLLYFIAIRKRVREYGKKELEIRRKQSRIITETFAGYADLEVNNAFYARKRSFRQGLEHVANYRLEMETLLRMPLFLSELSVIVGLTLLTTLGTGNIKTLVGIFAVAAFRLLPALKDILSRWTLIQNTMSSLQVIEEGLKNSNPSIDTTKELLFERKILFQNVTYTYENGEQVLQSFNCCIHKGEYIGFSGYSGVGKSTLFNLLLGFIEPQQGEIWIDETPLKSSVQTAWLKKIGYVQQDVFIFQGSLAENIALGVKDINKDKLECVVKQACLFDWVTSLPQGVDTLLGEYGGRLSGGQKQRIGIARALYKEAEIILLDEATSALDNETEKEINDTLNQLRQHCKELTILSIAHRESSLTYCDRVIKIENFSREGN